MKSIYLLSALALTACSTAAPIRERNLATAGAWPTRGWTKLEQVDPESFRRNQAQPACQEFVRYWTRGGGKDALRTDQLVVVKNGLVAYQYEAPGFSPNTPHSLWSASKSVTSTLVGAAVEQNKLRLTQKLADFFPATVRRTPGPNEARFSEITIEDLLQMSSGFHWDESYEGSIQTSSVLDMVYLNGWRDMADRALQAPLLPEGPGKRWIYSSGNSNILMAILKQRYASQKNTMPWDLLFHRLGMDSVRFEQDAAGTFVGSSYVYTSALDLAKLGYLFLKDGIWEGQRILPVGWMHYSTQVSPPLLRPETPAEYVREEGVYARGLWLNADVKGLGLPFPNAPQDLYFAAGHYGQLLYVVPSLDLVIARTGWDSEYWSKIDAMVKRAVDCFGTETQ